MSGAGAADPVPSAVTPLLDGRLLLRQPVSGHRVGTDAVLLAAAVAPSTGDRVIDVGTGVGAVGLAVAAREPGVQVTLVEIVPELADLARGNVALNGLGERVSVATGDLFAAAQREALGRAAWIVSNPPYDRAEEVRHSPDPWRARAHRLEQGVGHGDWLRAMLKLCAPHGRLVLIHKPKALPALLEAAEGRLGHLRVMPIYAREGQPAIRVLFGGIVGSRAGLAIAPPLVLHGPDGRFAPRAAALHAGVAGLDLFA